MTTPAAVPNLQDYRDAVEEVSGNFTPVDPDDPASSPDVDTDTGGDFKGTHLDPDSESGKAAAPDVLGDRLDNDQPIPGQETKSYKEENKRGDFLNYGKNQREGIYKNASQERVERISPEDLDISPERLAALKKEAAGEDPTGGDPIDSQNKPLINAETVARANAVMDAEAAKLEAAGGTVLPSELVKDPDQNLDIDKTLVRIAVDGEEQFATLGEVVEAGGVNTLQKNRAATKRLEEAATHGRSLDAREEALTQKEKDLSGKLRTVVTKLLSEKATTTGDVPNKDRSDLDGAVKESVSDSIYRGDTEAGDAGLVKLITEVVSKLTDTQAAGGDSSVDKRVQTVLDEIGITVEDETTPTPAAGIRTPEETAANAVYQEKFADVVEASKTRPEVLSAATRRMAYLRTLPENRGRSLTELAVEAGNSVRHQYLQPEGIDVIPAEQLTEVISRKRKTPIPTRVQGASKSPAEEVNKTRAQRTQDAFANIKKARGQ